MRRAARAGALALLAAALITFPYWSEGWESSRFATTVLRDMLVFAILAMSLDLLVGLGGMPSLGHAAYFGAGAYAAAIAAQRLQTDLLLVSLGAAIAVGAVLALVIGTLVVRTAGIFFLMLTLAFAQIVFAIAFQWTGVTGGSNGFSGVARPELGKLWDANAPDRMYVLVAVSFVVVALLLWRIATSAYGRALAGVRENERRMRALGYDTARLRLSAFVLAGALAGAAGALWAYSQRFVSPGDAGIGTSVTAFVMVLIGGTGTIVGPAIGAGVVMYVERVLSSSIAWSQTVLGVLFVAFVLLARQGIAGLVLRAIRRT